MEPRFPLDVRQYVTSGDGDRMHWHDHLEIVLVLEGRGTFLFGRRQMPAEPGDVFFIDNSQPHVALADPGTSLRLLLVLFRPELIAAPGCRELDLGYLAPFRVDEVVASARVPGRSRLAKTLDRELRELERIAGRNQPAERYLMDAALRQVLALAIADRAADGEADALTVANTGDRREQIRPVLEYVDGHAREHITLEDAANVVHVSPSRIRHVFKDVTGISFKEYVTHVRVAEAKRLLLSTDMSVAQVASAVSYSNLHQFYKVFYRLCAMSPAEYRRYYTPAADGHVTAWVGADSVEAGDALEEATV
jgi:AraC-like DNA-binding protein